MIPTFLHSCIAQVRTLVREGKALHVSDKTAEELALVAGLFKEPVWLPTIKAGKGGELRDAALTAREVTPADIAWAWLKLAYVEPGCVTDSLWERGEWAKRAAECAELATIAARLCPEVRPFPLAEKQEEEMRAALAEFGKGTPMIRNLPVQAIGIDPHEGTREGARAAWSHVVAQCHAVLAPMLEAGKRDGKAGVCHGLVPILETYRRELEAM